MVFMYGHIDCWFPTRMFLNGITVLWIILRSYEICILKLKTKKKLTNLKNGWNLSSKILFKIIK